jgi:hypothetical protein
MFLLQTSYIYFLLSLNIFEKVKYSSKTISRIISPLNLDFFREIGIFQSNFFIPYRIYNKIPHRNNMTRLYKHNCLTRQGNLTHYYDKDKLRTQKI